MILGIINLLVLVDCRRLHVSPSPGHPEVQLISFGFVSGGKYEVNIESSAPSQYQAFLATNQDIANLYKSRKTIQAICTDPTIHLSDINSSFTSTNYNWNGVLGQNNIYSLYVLSCGPNRTNFEVNLNFSNPNSLLDSRDEILPQMYMGFVVIYYVISIIWIFNAALFYNFRVPLHTIFLLLPMIRGISLSMSASYWKDKRTMEEPPAYKSYVISILEFSFYTLLFSGLAFACAGFCIYRNNLCSVDSAEIKASSAVLTASILITPVATNVIQAFFFIGLIAFSLMWYLKQIILSMNLISRLLQEGCQDPQVNAKVELSHKFVVTSFSTVFVTILLSSLATGMEMQKSICSMVLEFGLLFGVGLQLRFFLLRKQYCGVITEVIQKQKIVYQLRTIVEPKDQYVAFCFHEETQ